LKRDEDETMRRGSQRNRGEYIPRKTVCARELLEETWCGGDGNPNTNVFSILFPWVLYHGKIIYGQGIEQNGHASIHQDFDG
jgi:hypothetical protein